MTKQYKKLFEIDGVKLEFDEKALKAIAKRLLKETGARGLRAILEEVMLDVMYEIPSRNDVEKCIIIEDTIMKSAEPTLVYSEAKKRSKEASKGKNNPKESVS